MREIPWGYLCNKKKRNCRIVLISLFRFFTVVNSSESIRCSRKKTFPPVSFNWADSIGEFNRCWLLIVHEEQEQILFLKKKHKLFTKHHSVIYHFSDCTTDFQTVLSYCGRVFFVLRRRRKNLRVTIVLLFFLFTLLNINIVQWTNRWSDLHMNGKRVLVHVNLMRKDSKSVLLLFN